MSRTHRLFDLMQALRRRRQPVSGAALAREAGVSLRTLYRDIAALQALGAEIDGEPGLGYVLRPGFLLPPLMLSAAEIEALALGAQWVARRTDEGLSQAARNAMAKIAAVLPPSMQQKLEDDALIVGQGWERRQAVALSVLRQALQEERKLAIAYSDEKGSRTARVIWPAALGFFELHAHSGRLVRVARRLPPFPRRPHRDGGAAGGAAAQEPKSPRERVAENDADRNCQRRAV